jgi:hypothetical protein
MPTFALEGPQKAVQCTCECHETFDGNGEQQWTIQRIQSHKKVSETNINSIEMAVKSGMPVMTLSETAFGIVGPGFPLPPGVPQNFALKQEVTLQLQRGIISSGEGLGNKRGEMMYLDYHDNICANEKEWMDFFVHPEN